ncbi:MAG: tetratricopeptide repeat protein [bacterium]
MGHFKKVLFGHSGAMNKKIATILAAVLIIGVFVVPLAYVVFIDPDGPVSRLLTPSRFEVSRLEQRAYPHFYGGDFKQAKPELEAIIKKAPRNIRARLMLGNACARTGEIDKGIAQFKGVLKINPRQDEAYANLGAVFERQGTSAAAEGKDEDAMRHFLEAEKHYKEALANLREKKKGFMDRFSLLSRMGQVDKSVVPATKREMYEEALERVAGEKAKLK